MPLRVVPFSNQPKHLSLEAHLLQVGLGNYLRVHYKGPVRLKGANQVGRGVQARSSVDRAATCGSASAADPDAEFDGGVLPSTQQQPSYGGKFPEAADQQQAGSSKVTVAAIDIGTNSFHLVIGVVRPNSSGGHQRGFEVIDQVHVTTWRPCLADDAMRLLIGYKAWQGHSCKSCFRLWPMPQIIVITFHYCVVHQGSGIAFERTEATNLAISLVGSTSWHTQAGQDQLPVGLGRCR